MGNVFTLSEMAAELDRRQDSKRDFVLDTRRMEAVTGTESPTPDGPQPIPALSIDAAEGPEEFPINDHCHSQIAAKLDIPKRYYDRMLEPVNTDLWKSSVNHWLWHHPDKRMVRTLDGKARAFLSDRYRRLDDFDLMEHVLPILSDMPDVEFRELSLTDTRLYVKVTLPRVQAEVKVGDIVQSGVLISNSEVGAGTLIVAPYMFRLKCLNGMTATEYGKSKRHVGKRIDEEDESLYSESTLRLDDQAFFAKVADLVRAACDEAVFNTIVQNCRELAELRVEGTPIDAVTELSKRGGITDGEQESILKHLVSGGDLSAWGYLNAITAQARETESRDRANELEVFAGKLLQAPRKELVALGVK